MHFKAQNAQKSTAAELDFRPLEEALYALWPLDSQKKIGEKGGKKGKKEEKMRNLFHCLKKYRCPSINIWWKLD